jgi:hypothetical protein
MSHGVQIQTQVKDAAAVRAGCKRLALGEPTEGARWLTSSFALLLGRVSYKSWERFSGAVQPQSVATERCSVPHAFFS